jgi:acyl carrier protein
METVLQILHEINSDIDSSNQDDLIDSGLLNSLDIMGLISDLEDAFDIEISMEEVVPENFNSAEAIYALVTRLK